MKNHIEFTGNTPDEYEHYHQLRVNPNYRLECMMAEIEARNQPSLASMNSPALESHNPPQPEPEWNRLQWDTVQQLTSRVQHVENKLNEHVDKAKKRASDRL